MLVFYCPNSSPARTQVCPSDSPIAPPAANLTSLLPPPSPFPIALPFNLQPPPPLHHRLGRLLFLHNPLVSSIHTTIPPTNTPGALVSDEHLRSFLSPCIARPRPLPTLFYRGAFPHLRLDLSRQSASSRCALNSTLFSHLLAPPSTLPDIIDWLSLQTSGAVPHHGPHASKAQNSIRYVRLLGRTATCTRVYVATFIPPVHSHSSLPRP